MENTIDNKVNTEAKKVVENVTKAANTTAKKVTATKKTAAKKVTTTAKKATTAAKKAAPAAKKTVAKKATTAKKVVSKKVENVIDATQNPKSKLKQVVDAGKATGKIVGAAGTSILGKSIATTKAIAGVYTKASKKAFEIGKDAIGDTVKIASKNQKEVRETSAKAFKETIETIKDSNLIENPLKGFGKRKK